LNILGKEILKKGPDGFFLQPGETLSNLKSFLSKDGGVKNAELLANDEALLLIAR
jgi:hypothetical protein